MLTGFNNNYYNSDTMALTINKPSIDVTKNQANLKSDERNRFQNSPLQTNIKKGVQLISNQVTSLKKDIGCLIKDSIPNNPNQSSTEKEILDRYLLQSNPIQEKTELTDQKQEKTELFTQKEEDNKCVCMFQLLEIIARKLFTFKKNAFEVSTPQQIVNKTTLCPGIFSLPGLLLKDPLLYSKRIGGKQLSPNRILEEKKAPAPLKTESAPQQIVDRINEKNLSLGISERFMLDKDSFQGLLLTGPFIDTILQPKGAPAPKPKFKSDNLKYFYKEILELAGNKNLIEINLIDGFISIDYREQLKKAKIEHPYAAFDWNYLSKDEKREISQQILTYLDNENNLVYVHDNDRAEKLIKLLKEEEANSIHNN